MKNQLIIFLVALIGSSISCTHQKGENAMPGDKIVALQTEPTPVIDSMMAPIYKYPDEEWNAPIDSCTLPIDINGLRIDCGYSFEELIRVFGEPTEIVDFWNKSGYWSAYYRTGYHTKYGFEYTKEYGIKDFVFYVPGFTIYNGLIEVGKHISVFKTLGCGRLGGRVGVYSNVEKGSYRFCTTNDLNKNVFLIETDKKGIITSIIFYRHEDSGAAEGEEP